MRHGIVAIDKAVIPAQAGMTEERKPTVSPNAIALPSRGRRIK
jgi:hypothetical protein